MARRGNENQEVEHGSWYKPEVKANIKLTLAFAKAVGKNQDDQSDNLVVSPYNATAALSMVALGAEGKTREEMAKTLYGVSGADLDAAAAAYAKLNTEVLAANKGQVTLTTANGVWANQDLVSLRDTFVDEVKKSFGAEVSAESFGQPTVDKINKWASDNTNGLITEVLKELKPDDAAVLASALHFKGEWTHKFDKKLTEEKLFTSDGELTNVTPTMHQKFEEEGGFRYQKGKDYEAVSMTYGEEDHSQRGQWKNPTMRIVLVRPTNDDTSARDFLQSQDATKVPAWLANSEFEPAVGSVELPRMDIKQNHALKDTLQDMGIKQAFVEGGADFTKMVDKGGKSLYISSVSHDTVFKTDETGSEAAAVTTAVMTTESVRMPPIEIDMKIDRSFLFALQDVKTNAVLFVGVVNKPNDDMKPIMVAKRKKQNGLQP